MQELDERTRLFKDLNACEYIFRATCEKAGYSHLENCRLFEGGRLAHKGPEAKPCRLYGPEDTFDCYYIFGETLLHTRHGFGECPYLKEG